MFQPPPPVEASFLVGVQLKLPGDPGFEPAKKIKGPSVARSEYINWKRDMRAAPCHYCGGPGGTIDHVIPASLGGKMKPGNCVPACAPCNNFRGNQPYEAFKEFGWKGRPFAVSRGDADAG